MHPQTDLGPGVRARIARCAHAPACFCSCSYSSSRARACSDWYGAPRTKRE